MATHPILPGIVLQSNFCHPAFESYLKQWLECAISRANAGDTAASICHQAVIIDLIVNGNLRYDWLSVMQNLLTDNDSPTAYSKGFGKQLYKFDKQILQSTIHSIHTRWWVENLNDPTKVDHERFAKMILAKKCADGLIYDADVSKTTLRHRITVELCMSAVMSIEILKKAGKLTDKLCLELATNLTDQHKVPQFGHITSEQFRLAALRLLGHENLFPLGIVEHINACAEGLDIGWCDFAIKSKVDAYMGTVKRTAHDKPIHSPLITCHVAALLDKVEHGIKRDTLKSRLIKYAQNLAKDPMNIPAFQMRDVFIPFGADVTPIEATCASWLIANKQTGISK
jgi:hypothetical protein